MRHEEEVVERDRHERRHGQDSSSIQVARWSRRTRWASERTSESTRRGSPPAGTEIGVHADRFPIANHFAQV